MSTVTDSPLVSFYRNETPNNDGYKIEEILSWGPDQWEACHSFIQWLFPTTTKSNFNPEAPVLTEEDIELFSKDLHLSTVFDDVVSKMMDIYGIELELEYEALKWREDGDHDVQWWLKTFNHNALRITRILECLNHFGRHELAKRLYEFLIASRPISPTTKGFWSRAAFPDGE